MSVYEKFKNLLNEKGMKVLTDTLENGKELICFTVNSEYFSNMEVHIVFDSPAEKTAIVKVNRVAAFPPEKRLMALLTANDLNCSYRWTTFSITPQMWISASTDVMFEEESGPLVVFKATYNLLNIINCAYPAIQKLLDA